MQVNPLSALVFVFGALTLGIAVYAWRQRSVVAARAFAVFMLSVAVYVLGYSFELASPDLATMLLWNKVQYAGILCYAELFLIFTLQYTGRGRWLTRRRMALLFVLPAILLALKLGDESWHLIYRTAQVDATGLIPLLDFTRGPAYYVVVANNLALFTLSLYLLWQKRSHASALYRSQTSLMLAAASCLYLVYLYYLSGVPLFPSLRHLDINPFVFTLWTGAVSWAMFRHRLFDLNPIARDALIEHLRDGVVVLDAQQRLVDANPAALKIFGWARAPVGQPVAQVFPNWAALARLGQADDPSGASLIAVSEIGLDGARQDAGGSSLIYEASLETLKDQDGARVGNLVLLHDVTARKRAEEKLREISLEDELTGLTNRRGFNVLAGQMLQMAARMGVAATLIYGDLDELKQINDTQGHAAGDQALVATAQILKGACRSSDIVARIGGDEFVVLALEPASAAGAAGGALLERIEALVHAHNERNSRPCDLSISLGLARSEPGAMRSIEALLDAADQAMYAHKATRKPA
jgi:diguanylate cyclase (GGDEF)-like protein/PAS domain S-box-containing protein